MGRHSSSVTQAGDQLQVPEGNQLQAVKVANSEHHSGSPAGAASCKLAIQRSPPAHHQICGAAAPIVTACPSALIAHPPQLPPTVISEAAARAGLSRTLFERLQVGRRLEPRAWIAPANAAGSHALQTKL